jgi:dUTP pyrophosphatase
LSANGQLIPTGLHIAIPEGCYGQILGRSSLAMKGIVIPGGVIDSSYRGEVQVILLNFGPDEFIVNPGDRIAQLVILPIYTGQLVRMAYIDALGVTERGDTGFGSTGANNPYPLCTTATITEGNTAP